MNQEKKRNLAIGKRQISAVVDEEIVDQLDLFKEMCGFRSRGAAVAAVLEFEMSIQSEMNKMIEGRKEERKYGRIDEEDSEEVLVILNKKERGWLDRVAASNGFPTAGRLLRELLRERMSSTAPLPVERKGE